MGDSSPWKFLKKITDKATMPDDKVKTCPIKSAAKLISIGIFILLVNAGRKFYRLYRQKTVSKGHTAQK